MSLLFELNLWFLLREESNLIEIIWATALSIRSASELTINARPSDSSAWSASFVINLFQFFLIKKMSHSSGEDRYLCFCGFIKFDPVKLLIQNIPLSFLFQPQPDKRKQSLLLKEDIV